MMQAIWSKKASNNFSSGVIAGAVCFELLKSLKKHVRNPNTDKFGKHNIRHYETKNFALPENQTSSQAD
jgi:hypothetical protein